MAISSSSKSSLPTSINVPPLTVDPHKAIDVVKNVFKHNFGPLLKAVPSLTAGESEMKTAYNNLFNQVAIDFKKELATIKEESQEDPTADIKPGGKIYKHVTTLNPENEHAIRTWRESRHVYIQMNNFFGAIKGIGDPEVKLKAMNHFLSMHLACANGVRERLAQIQEPLLPGNKLITATYTNAREKFLITSGIATRQESIHAVTDFENDVLQSPPSDEGKEWTETFFKSELENTIETLLETDLQNLFNGLTELFKEAPQPLQLEPLSEEKPSYTEEEEPILAAFQSEVREFTKEIIKFHEEHLMECAYFLPETTGLEESISHMRMDENDGRFVSFSRENIIADVAEKILPVLTLEAKLRLFQHNPEFFAIPKLLADLLAGEPEHLEQITDAIDAAFPGEPNKIRELMGKTDEASGTGNTTLHFLLQKGASVSNMLGRDCIPVDLLAQANLATPGHPKGQTPVDLLCLPDLMMVRLLCEQDHDGWGKKLTPVLAESELAKPEALRGSLKENAKFITAMANLKEFSELNAAQFAAITKATSVPDLEVPGAREASKRTAKFVIKNLERLSKLDAEQIGATGLAIRQSPISADFVSKHTDPWFGSSAQAMKAYTRLLGTHGWSKWNFSGADFLRRKFEAFQQLDDNQKEETSLCFEVSQSFLKSNAKEWFTLNAAQMRWTRRAHALTGRFVDAKFSHSWMKMPDAKMMQLVQSIETEKKVSPYTRPVVLKQFDVLRKLSIMQMKHTLELIKTEGGIQMLDGYFETWKNLDEMRMKTLVDVFKVQESPADAIKLSRWSRIPGNEQRILAQIARRGIGWSTLSKNVLAPVNTTLPPPDDATQDPPDDATLHQNVKDFLNDDIWLSVFVADPTIVAFPDRLHALQQVSETPGSGSGMPAGQQGPAPAPTFKVALSTQPDLIAGLDSVQIIATARMFSLPGGAECIRDPQWKSYSALKMKKLCDAYQISYEMKKAKQTLPTGTAV